MLAALDADAILLTGFDHDHGLAALDAFRAALAAAGTPYPHRFALNPNTGRPTGLDIDGNDRLSEARDAQGWGRFPGAGGMAILSRLPVAADGARDFSALLWADLPAALLPPMSDAERRVQRLSTTAHWDVPLMLPDGTALHLLAWHATPPVFDGPDDRNGRRNHDEAAFWSAYLDGAVPAAVPPDRFVLLGDANLDPVRGDGRAAALLALLSDSRLTDPHGPAPTVDYGPPLGGLRLDYLLPAAGLPVTASGILRPDPAKPALAAALGAASRHWPVWADIRLP